MVLQRLPPDKKVPQIQRGAAGGDDQAAVCLEQAQDHDEREVDGRAGSERRKVQQPDKQRRHEVHRGCHRHQPRGYIRVLQGQTKLTLYVFFHSF